MINKGSRARFLVDAAALALSGLWASTAHAQETAPQTASESEDIVVTAQRRDERLIDVPLSVSVVGGDTLAQEGVRTTQQLYQVVPGINMTANGGSFLQAGIRGVTSLTASTGNSPTVPIYIDDIYVANATAQRTALPDIERIEVLKGPQGTLFGRNATGGAIRITTKGPSFDTGGFVEGTYGSYDTRELAAYLSGPIAGDTLAGSISGYLSTGDTYVRDPRTGDPIGRSNVQVLRAKLLFTPTSAWQSTLSYAYSRIDDNGTTANQPYDIKAGWVIRDPAAPGFISTEPRESALSFQPQYRVRDTRIGWKNEFDLGFGTLNSMSAYAYTKAAYLTDLDGTSSTLFNFTSDVRQTDRMYTQEFTLAGPSKSRLNYILGAFYFNDYATVPMSITNRTSGYTSRVTTNAWAVFGELYYDLTNSLNLIAGARYSKETQDGFARSLFASNSLTQKESWDSFTPRFSARYSIDAGTNLYVTWSKGFKAGGFNIATLSPVSFDPETLEMIEAGLKLKHRGFQLNLAGFHYDYKNLQYSTAIAGPTGAPAAGSFVQNAASAKIWGFEADGVVSLGRQASLRANFAWLPHANYSHFPDAVANVPTPTSLLTNGNGGCATGLTPPCGPVTVVFNASGNRMIRAPEFTSNVTGQYTLPNVFGGELALNASVYYSSGINFDLTGNLHQDPYATVSVGAAWASPNGRFKLTARGTNVTNAAIISGVGDIVFAQVKMYERGRHFEVSMTYNF